ncbi:MAG: serine/threonine-protein kinase [Acidimicrobiales bacterium]
MRYETVRRIGRGGMGVVDLGRDAAGHEFALKRLSLHGTPEELERARARIRREADVLRRLDHPAIVGLRDVVDDGDDLILVMDFLPGGNLAQRMAERGPMPAGEIRPLMNRLLDGLAAAHRQGVVHRDIKPANVLFDADGDAALADFGAAMHRDATSGLTASEMVIGTPGFMAPEQARGETATTASDVFSLAATVAYAATGSGPFGTADPQVLMLRAAAGRTEKLPRTLPLDLRRQLAAMLDRDPMARPTAAEVRGGPAGTQPRNVVGTRTVRRTGRRRGALVGAVATALVAGAALAVVTGGDGNGGPLDSAPPTRATRTSAVATTTTAPCINLRFLPCGGRRAPHTDGRRCLAGYADYDDDRATGCEAAADRLTASTPLRSVLRANLVPSDDVDTYPMPVNDKVQLACNGRVQVTLKAPPGVSQILTVLDGDKTLGQATSADGVPASVSLREPNCIRDDSTTLRVKVMSVGSDRSAGNYTLTKSGSY